MKRFTIVLALVGCGGGTPTVEFAEAYATAYCAKHEAAVTCAQQMGGTFCGLASGAPFDRATCETEQAGFALDDLHKHGITDDNWDSYKAQAELCLTRISQLTCADYKREGSSTCYSISFSALFAVEAACGWLD